MGVSRGRNLTFATTRTSVGLRAAR